MAGNNQTDRIGGAGASDSAKGARSAEGACDLGIGAGGAGGNAAELFPDGALESSGANIERQIEARFAAAEMAKQGIDPGAEGGGRRAKLGAGIFAAESGAKSGVAGAEEDGADAAVGGSDEQAAEGGIDDGIGDGHASTAAAVGAWSHAELARGVFIDATRGAISGGIECCGHVISFMQAGFE